MFFRIKTSGERRYLQIAKNTREGARTIQRVVAALGRVEDLRVDGGLDVLLRSGARVSETALLISSLQAGTLEAETAQHDGQIAKQTAAALEQRLFDEILGASGGARGAGLIGQFFA